MVKAHFEILSWGATEGGTLSDTQSVLVDTAAGNYTFGMAVTVLSTQGVDAMRRAGLVAAATLASVGSRLAPGITTKSIDDWVRQDTAARGGYPAQLGYHGFPASVCTSRNEVVCHGIPSPGEVLQLGDIVNVDVTTRFEGFHGDTSCTFYIGPPGPEARHLVETVERCLQAGIKVVREGVRLGDIGAAITELATTEGCTVVREYCGHGIGRAMHMPPQVSHVGQAGTGLRLRAGMAITIEPMINLGGPAVRILDDGWTVVTADGALSAQAEHTLVVTKKGSEVLTPRPT